MINEREAVACLLDLLKIEGQSGRESAIAEAVKKKLAAAGCEASWMRHDTAHRRIMADQKDLPFEIGNLIVKLPGTRRGPRVMFSSHLDVVPLVAGAKPVKRGNRIESAGKTGLGADNRTAVACLVTLATTLRRKKLDHPPLTLLFTVGEEVGLRGSKHVRHSDLGKPVMGFNYDSGAPNQLIIGATGADRWKAIVHGISAHAGVHPEDGVSATLIASRAITRVAGEGYFGKIQRGTRRGTANIGRLEGGDATNQVTDRIEIRGECRSHNPRFLDQITAAWRRSFERESRALRNVAGDCGSVDFDATRDYPSFKLPKGSDVVKTAARAVKSLGDEPVHVIANGGLDANWLTLNGVPTVTLGAGQHNAHRVDEYCDIDEYLGGCRLAVEIASNA